MFSPTQQQKMLIYTSVILLFRFLQTSGDQCASNPCMGGRVCVPASPTYRCYCPLGYIGSSCQIHCESMQADIVFVVESLESLGDAGWHISLEIVTAFISTLNPKQRLTMAPSCLHFGVVAYSTTAHVRVNLRHYQRAGDIITEVEHMPYINEGDVSSIEAAFRVLETTVFGNGRPGDRPHVPNVAVFIVQPMTSNSVSPEVVRMQYESTGLAGSEMLVYSIGSGDTVRSVDYLTALTGGVSNRVMLAGDIHFMKNVTDNLLSEICLPQALSVPGVPGEAGQRGVPGSEGMMGPSGKSGPPGTQGVTGPDGMPGSKGPQGPKGQPGYPGVTGQPGATGHSGPGGDLGQPGTIGPQGIAGAPGERPIGLLGADGQEGGVGHPGALGSPGHPGRLGAVGWIGPPGVSGQPGAVGEDGPEGPPGGTGAQGIVGLKGPLGDIGPMGISRVSVVGSCIVQNLTCEHICVSLKVGFRCACFPGYQIHSNGRNCEDIINCTVNNGGCEHFCHDIGGDHVCSCLQGFTLSHDLTSCIDVDECCKEPLGYSPCTNNTHRKCINTYGSYACLRIPDGYQLDMATGRLEAVTDNTARLAWNPVRREVVVALLSWLACLSVLVFLTIIFTWLSNDLLLRMLAEHSPRRKLLNDHTPRKFFFAPKIDTSLSLSNYGSKESVRVVPGGKASRKASNRLRSRYMDNQGFLVVSEQEQDDLGTHVTSTPLVNLQGNGPSPTASSTNSLPEVSRSALAVCSSIAPPIEDVPTS